MTGISAEEAKALADKLIGQETVPRRIPASDDVEGQKSALCGALASALLTATEMPLHVLQPVVADLAAQLVAYGVRQTEYVDPAAIHAPAWITDGIKAHAVKLADPPQHTTAAPFVVRTAVAPDIPDVIHPSARAVPR